MGASSDHMPVRIDLAILTSVNKPDRSHQGEEKTRIDRWLFHEEGVKEAAAAAEAAPALASAPAPGPSAEQPKVASPPRSGKTKVDVSKYVKGSATTTTTTASGGSGSGSGTSSGGAEGSDTAMPSGAGGGGSSDPVAGDSFEETEEKEDNLAMYLLGGAVAVAVGIGAYSMLARRRETCRDVASSIYILVCRFRFGFFCNSFHQSNYMKYISLAVTFLSSPMGAFSTSK